MGRGRREKVYLMEGQRDKLEKISRNGQATCQKSLICISERDLARFIAQMEPILDLYCSERVKKNL